MSTFEELHKPKKVAGMLGWSVAKVYKEAACGALPCLRHGRSVRIPAAALQRWIERNTTGGGESAGR